MPAKLRDILDYYADPEKFPAYAEDFLRIRTRSQELVSLRLNRAQRLLHRVLEQQRQERGFVAALVLKARRLGVSTYTEARYYHRASMRPRQHVYIVAHRDDSCETLFQMTKLMHSENPLKPPTDASNRKELRFKKIQSQYGFASADSPDAARSKDITLLHGSEVAFWREDRRLYTALMECLPTPGRGYWEAILESTANGFGNLWQKMVYETYAEGRHPYAWTPEGHPYAWHNPGETLGERKDWILVFLPWFVLPENSLPFDTAQQREDFQRILEVPVFRKDLGRSGPSEERELQLKYGLTPEQLHWRRWQIANKHNGDVRLFRQENPATVEEAFLSAGGNVFAPELCDELEKLCTPPVHEATLAERAGKVVARRMAAGPLRVWEAPRPDTHYLVTVDPAGGMRELQTDRDAPDFTCMDVWRREGRYLIQVAQWHGHLDYDLIGDEAMMLARLYRKAPIAVLRLNHGLTVLAKLREEGWPWIIQDEDGKQGILESRTTKRQLVDRVVEYARDGWLHLACKETVSEMRTYVERNGKMGAEDGCKDDRVSSVYCAVHVHTRLSYEDTHKRQDERRKESTRLALTGRPATAKWGRRDRGYRESGVIRL